MAAIISRHLPLESTLRSKSVLLLGPRRTGKSFILRHQLKPDRVFDLLRADTFRELSFRPSMIRESLRPSDRLVVIDEIQKLPLLMDEVHSLIEDTSVRFVLTGSSARKLRRSHTALMAGRTRRLLLHPFTSAELGNRFSLERALRFGTLPPVILQEDPEAAFLELQDYAGDYLREEILAEALVRKIDAFSRFLSVAASMNAELLNYEAVASDAQVPARTIREYFSVLEDTLIGNSLEPLRFKGSKSRKAIATSKFYFFDCGIVNALLGRRLIGEDSPEFGNLFETWLHHELRSYRDYRFGGSGSTAMSLEFWRNPTGDEVDFVINGEVGIEAKATRLVGDRQIRGLMALDGIHRLRRKIVVSRDRTPRKIGSVEILPWRHFLEELWSGNLLS